MDGNLIKKIVIQWTLILMSLDKRFIRIVYYDVGYFNIGFVRVITVNYCLPFYIYYGIGIHFTIQTTLE